MFGHLNKGPWGSFIRSGSEIYDRLPDSLLSDLVNCRPDENVLRPLSDREFARVYGAVKQKVDRIAAIFNPAYHNPDHFLRVETCGLAAVDVYNRGDGRRLPAAVRQALKIAFYAHDAGHSGSTFRIDAKRGVYLPELKNCSAEWASAFIVDGILKQQGVNPPLRLFVLSVIWSSTFGGKTDRGRELHIPDVVPQTVSEAIMRAADVCPDDSLEQSVQQSVRVNYYEIPAQNSPSTFLGFVAARMGFLNYTKTCFDQLDNLSGMSLTFALGWRQRLEEFIRITKLINRNPNCPAAQDLRATVLGMGQRLKRG